jgi:hypothetical protein
MFLIQPEGSTVVLSGPKCAKTLRVTPAFRCASLLEYAFGPDAKQTLEVTGLTAEAQAAGYERVELVPPPAPPESEDATESAQKPLKTALTTSSAKPKSEPKPKPKPKAAE